MHNKLVTQQIVDKANGDEYSDKVAIACNIQVYYIFTDAAKKRHEYLVSSNT